MCPPEQGGGQRRDSAAVFGEGSGVRAKVQVSRKCKVIFALIPKLIWVSFYRAAGGQLVEADAATQKDLEEALGRALRQFGGKSHEEMLKLPSFNFKGAIFLALDLFISCVEYFSVEFTV